MKTYEVTIKGKDWKRYVDAESTGKAKVEYWRDIRESWPDIPFTLVRCREVKRENVPPSRVELAKRQAEAFNATHPEGTMLRYWSGLREGEPTGVAPIRHAATVMCDHAVIWLKGVSSCHSLTHVEAVS